MKKMKLFTFISVLCLVLCLSVSAFASTVTDTGDNDTTLNAQKISLSDTICGSIDKTSDVDYYTITLPASGELGFSMTSYMQFYTIEIINNNGDSLWYTELNEWNATVGFRKDSYSLDLLAGDYYVKITGWERYDGNSWYGKSTGNYELGVSYKSANATETESNNSVAVANYLPIGSIVKGQIATNDLYDFHKVSLPSSGRLLFQMTSYMQFYTIELFDNNGNSMWYTDLNEWNATVGFRKDSYSLDLLAGDYYVKITGWERYDGNSWYGRSTGIYELGASYTNANSTETESNNSLATADYVPLGSTVNGHIAINDTYDFYKVVIEEPSTLQVDFTSYMQYYCLYTYDANGNELTYSENHEWNSDTYKREDVHKKYFEPGTYYIKITGYRYSSKYPSTGNYTMYVDIERPDAPTVKGSNVASSGKNKLTWNPVPGAVKYEVYRATSKNGKYSRMSTVKTASYTNTTAKAGKGYYYYVVAVDHNGVKSDKSNIIYRTCDYARPNVTASNIASTGKIKLTWKAVDGATSYKIYRSTTKNGTYSLMKTVKDGAVSYINANAVAGKMYYYKVKAYGPNSSATSVYSVVDSRTCDLPRPTVSITTSSGKPKVSWAGITNAKEYKIYRATSKTGKYSPVKTTKNKYWKDTTAKKGKTYYYKVVAVHSKSAANSAYSNIVYKKCTK